MANLDSGPKQVHRINLWLAQHASGKPPVAVGASGDEQVSLAAVIG
jgi:hypothetical protein